MQDTSNSTSSTLVGHNNADMNSSRDGGLVVPVQDGLVHAVGSIITNTDVEKCSIPSMITNYQVMPNNPIQEFVARDTLIWTVVNATPPAAMSFIQIAPWGVFFNNVAVSEKIKNYVLCRGSLVITGSVIVPPGCFGLLKVVAVPNGVYGSAGTIANSNPSVLFPHQMEHGVSACVDLSSSSDFELKLPFIFPHEWARVAGATVESIIYSWNLFLFYPTVIQTVQVAGSTAYSIKVYARSDDLELCLPQYQSGKPKGKQDFSSVTSKVNKYATEKFGGKLSVLTSSAASMAEKLSAVPYISALAVPAAFGFATASKVLDFFGFTRTTENRVTDYVARKIHGNIPNVDCPDPSELAALFSSNSISPDPRCAGANGEDTGAFDQLFQYWTYVGKSTWAQSQVTGTLLFSVPVTPYLAATGTLDMTVAGYNGVPFGHWRGGMEFKIYVPVSKFHRGALQVCWNPGTALSTVDPTNLVLNTIFEIAPGVSHVFRVGYASMYAMLRSVCLECPATGVFNDRFQNGRLDFRVVNPLVSMATASTVDILIFARAMPDMEFAVPSDVFRYQSAGSILTTSLASLTYQASLGDERQTEFIHTLVPVSEGYPLATMCTGETFRSTRALLQKFSKIATGENALVESPNGRGQWFLAHLLNWPNALTISGGTKATGDFQPIGCWLWQRHYVLSHVGVATSTRYKIRADNEPIEEHDGAVAVSATHYEPNSYSAYATPMAFVDGLIGTEIFQDATKATVEVTVPWYAPMRWQSPIDVPDLATGYTAESQVLPRVDLIRWSRSIRGATATHTPYPHVFCAYGPDVRLGVFRKTPRLALLGAPPASQYWAQAIWAPT